MQTTIHGKTFEVESEPSDYWGWIKDGLYDPEWEVYDQFLKPEHVFIDLGAWVGAHSLYASKIARRVIAVEPDPIAFITLQKNLNGSAALHNTAVGKDSVITLGSSLLGWSTTRANPAAIEGLEAWKSGQTVQVVSMPLAYYLPKNGRLFIKCDIEGSEEEILKDVSIFASRKPTVLIELHPFWWHDKDQTQQDFERLRKLYRHVKNVYGDTWVLYE